jgi:hypothetical protein
MKLSDLTLESLKEFVSGDNGLTPGLSGPKILKLFNQVGFKDVYKFKGGGMPNSLSRNDYVLEKLYEINGTKELQRLLEIVFDPRHFVQDNSRNIDEAIIKLNPLIQQDGYRLEEVDGKYKTIGADLPEDIEVEIHFEEIQSQIIEKIRSAKFSIWIAVAWFTDKVLMRELYNKKQAGINVRLVVLDDEINKKYGFKYEDYFETKRANPHGAFENIMHHKFCIIDLKTVLHGSYNWTNKARWNKETISIDVSRELSEKFATEFIEIIK